MKLSVLSRPLAASTLFLAAACGGSGTTADAGNDAAVNEALASLDETMPDEAGESAPVDLVSLPPAPADAPAGETAPLTQAAAIATEIDGGAGVERVPYEGGWAWRRDGRILRTASRDGRRVSYFRPGDSAPFLIQQGEETFAYQGGRPQRAFDRRGRPGAVSARRVAEARRLADDSRRDRARAEQAPRRPENDSAGPSRGVDDPRRGGGDNRAGDGRGDDRDGRGSRTGPDDRRGERGGNRSTDDRGPEDRRGRGDRGDDAERGNRQ